MGTLPPELERFWGTGDGLTVIQRAELFGIDLSLLDENLRLTPEQRHRQNDLLLNKAEALRAALAQSNEQS